MSDIKVRKRGGGLEPWNIDKTINSLSVAGLSEQEAEGVGKLIEGWVSRVAEDKVISSIKIRDKILEILAVVDEMAKNAYEAYKK